MDTDKRDIFFVLSATSVAFTPFYPHWLRFGERINGSPREQRKRWDAKMAPQEREVIEVFLKLTPEKRKMVGEIIKALAK